jgi:phospholipid-translocating ATPase
MLSYSLFVVLLNGFFCFQICYFFYKNIAFGLTLFYFEAFTAFSGQSVYNDWYMLLFNVILTSLPVISLGVFEQDVSSEVCLQVSPINYLVNSNAIFVPVISLLQK